MFDEVEMEQDTEFDGREAGACGKLFEPRCWSQLMIGGRGRQAFDGIRETESARYRDHVRGSS